MNSEATFSRNSESNALMSSILPFQIEKLFLHVVSLRPQICHSIRISPLVWNEPLAFSYVNGAKREYFPADMIMAFLGNTISPYKPMNSTIRLLLFPSLYLCITDNKSSRCFLNTSAFPVIVSSNVTRSSSLLKT